MNEHVSWIIMGIAFSGVIVTAAGFMISWMREDRRHRWHLEELDHNARHLTIQDDAILDGTKAAKHAYMAANEVNAKIADLQSQINELLKQQSL